MKRIALIACLLLAGTALAVDVVLDFDYTVDGTNVVLGRVYTADGTTVVLDPPTTAYPYDVFYLFSADPTNASAPIINSGTSGTNGVNGAGALALTWTDSTYVNSDGGDYGSCGYVTTNWSALTCAAWVRWSASSGDNAAVGKWNTGSKRTWALYRAGASIYFGVSPDGLFGAGKLATSAYGVSNTWTHLAGTWEAAGNSKLYINGVHVATSAETSASMFQSNVPEEVGRFNNAIYYHSGDIDDVLIDDTVLSDTTISNLWYAGRSD